MNVQASETMREAWAALEGHAVNAAFPLRRYLGSSDHSGVFLSERSKKDRSAVALKLVPAVHIVAEVQLSRWLTAARFTHPHLLGILEAGRCQLDGQDYLYAVEEYADQNLAQLLDHRALTDDEAREMLAPALSALAYLHDKGFVQGQLKPSNILVVGDQLKLASDTIRPVGELDDAANGMSVYDAPEARDGECSAAVDLWALGVTLSEALTRRRPASLQEGRSGIVLPSDFSPAFREIVARCLKRRPADRPEIAELDAWLHGEPSVPATAVAAQPATIAVPAPAISPQPVKPAQPQRAGVEVSEYAAVQHPSNVQPSSDVQPPSNVQPPSKPRSLLPLVLGTIALLALGWAGMRMFRAEPAPTPPPAPVADVVEDAGVEAPAPLLQTSAPVVVPDEPQPVEAEAAEAEVASPVSVHEEIPEVPGRASRTIRGHVRVAVRVIVDKDGTVFAALTDDPGPSRYFERVAVDAAKKWTFPPVDTGGQRLMLLRFDFTRDGTTARAVSLQ